MGGFTDSIIRQFGREGIELKEDEIEVIRAIEVLDKYVNSYPMPRRGLDPVVGAMRCMHKTLFACVVRYVVKAMQSMVEFDSDGNITRIDGRLPEAFAEWCIKDGRVPFV